MLDYDPDPCNELPNEDQLLASIVRYLIDGHEYDAANVLLSCGLKFDNVRWVRRAKLSDQGFRIIARLVVHASRAMYDLFNEYDRQLAATQELNDVVATGGGSLPPGFTERDLAFPEGPKADIVRCTRTAIHAAIPPHVRLTELSYVVRLIEIDSDWREEQLRIARGKCVHNQALGAERTIVWMNHNFRSQTETKIAQALDQRKVLFFPNCKARLGIEKRGNLEPDFLVCHNGRWGILEIDGEPYHPPSRTVEDHTRDRVFKLHGIKVIEHFDAAYCWESPAEVVTKFLTILTAT